MLRIAFLAIGPMIAIVVSLWPIAGTGGSTIEPIVERGPLLLDTPSEFRITVPLISKGPPAASLSVVLEPAFPNLPEFRRPIAMLEAPGGQFLLALAMGQIWTFPKDGPYSEPRMIHNQLDQTVCCESEEAFLSIALDPEFDENGYIYAYYSPRQGARRTVLSRFETTGSTETLAVDIQSEFVILTVPQPFGNHNGGTVLFGVDGFLYLGLGDGGSGGDPLGYGQDISENLLGSVIRIDVRGATPVSPYRIPPDNPFVGSPDALPETWAYGLRNPWRMSFDPATGLLWAGDVGQERREEIDILRAGENYGWNIVEGILCYEPSLGCQSNDTILPVFDYPHSEGCSVTGGAVYRGDRIQQLRGWYVFGDFCTGRAWALDAAAAAAGEPAETIQLWSDGPTISSFATDSDGELYLLSFDGVGIYRLVAE